MRVFVVSLLLVSCHSFVLPPDDSSDSSEESEINLSPATVSDPTCLLEDDTNGICVMYYLCDKISRDLVVDGTGILDNRQTSSCPNYLEVCCHPHQVNATRAPPGTSKIAAFGGTFFFTGGTNVSASASAPPAASGASRLFVPTTDITRDWSYPLTYMFPGGHKTEDGRYPEPGEFPWMIAVMVVSLVSLAR